MYLLRDSKLSWPHSSCSLLQGFTSSCLGFIRSTGGAELLNFCVRLRYFRNISSVALHAEHACAAACISLAVETS